MNDIEILGYIEDLKTGEYSLFRKTPRDFIANFHLEVGLTYDVGMDQSNTCTGIGITDMSNSLLMILEVVNSGNVSFDIYRKSLKNIISAIFKGVNTRYYVMEEPLPYISKNQNKKLVELKNSLIDYFNSSECPITYKKFDTALPNVWRAGLIRKDNPHDKRSKEACVHEIIKKYPNTKEFIKISHNPTNNSGYDGFEGLGIIIGYKNRFSISNDNEIIKILGPKNTTKQGLAFTVYDNSNLEILNKLIAEIKTFNPKVGEPLVKYYNEEESLYANVKMSLVDNFTVTVVSNDIHIKSEQIKYNIKTDLDKKIYLVIVPLKLLRKSFIDFLSTTNYNMDIFY